MVIPVYNEVESLGALYESLSWSLQSYGDSYELIFVDDGSTDGSRAVLSALAADDSRVRVVLFRRNYGQTAAMAAGFERATGAAVVTMDADLQNDPADIPRMIERLEQGFDIVCGWRRDRKDALVTRLLPSRIANLMISWVTGVSIHDTGCSLKAYRLWVVRSLDLYSDMHRFIAALAAGLGARVTEVPVRHHARRFGKSKYGLGRIFRVLADLVVIKMLIQFAAHPIRWFILLSAPLFFAAPVFFISGWFKIENWQLVATGFDTWHMSGAAVTAVVAINVALLGFLAELQMKASGFFRQRVSVTVREAAR